MTANLPACSVSREMSAFAGELHWSARQVFLLAAEAEGLAHEQPRGVIAWIGEVGLLRLAVWKAADADGVVEAKTLKQLGVIIDFAAVP